MGYTYTLVAFRTHASEEMGEITSTRGLKSHVLDRSTISAIPTRNLSDFFFTAIRNVLRPLRLRNSGLERVESPLGEAYAQG